MQLLCLCKYSIGSSKVIICACLVLFISLIIAANVVLLPLPVGPVTKTSPLFLVTISLRTAGCFNSSNVGIFSAITLIAIASLFLCLKTFTLNLPIPCAE